MHPWAGKNVKSPGVHQSGVSKRELEEKAEKILIYNCF